jgi:hypothetical protein
MDAEIDHGRVIPKEPEKLPPIGRALLTVVEPAPARPEWAIIQPLLGTLKTKVDIAAWQRETREEWDARERAQW